MLSTSPSRQDADTALVLRCQQGDDRALDQLADIYAYQVYRFAYHMTGNTDDAGDIGQEALLRVFRALPRFRHESSFTTWFWRVVVNTYWDEMRKRKRRPMLFSEMVGDREDESSAPAERLTDGRSTEDVVLAGEEQKAVHRAVAEIPEPFRSVMVLFYLHGYSLSEIAEMQGTGVNTVKTRLHRARKHFREQLARQDGNLSGG